MVLQLVFKAPRGHRQEWNNFALRTQEWILEDIKKHCLDPKLSDDGVGGGGGDWFMSYLREAHREMYDDIDHSDGTALAKMKNAIGESGKKYKIGSISVPSCEEGFQRIVKEMDELTSQ